MKNILVTIPHSSTVIPPAIPEDNIDHRYDSDIALSIDSGTEILYGFKDFPALVFPYCRAYVDVNQSASILDDSAPIQTIKGNPVYIEIPSLAFRRRLIEAYHIPFHTALQNLIMDQGINLIFDGHSTMEGDEDPGGDRFDSDIAICNLQVNSESDSAAQVSETCPKELMYFYADYISSNVKANIAINNLYCTKTFGVIESYGQHLQPVYCPVLMQEVNKRIYLDDRKKMRDLRDIFEAGAKYAVEKYYGG